jgi:hypothetical protein
MVRLSQWRATKGQGDDRMSEIHAHGYMMSDGFLRGGTDDNTEHIQFRILCRINPDASG